MPPRPPGKVPKHKSGRKLGVLEYPTTVLPLSDDHKQEGLNMLTVVECFKSNPHFIRKGDISDNVPGGMFGNTLRYYPFKCRMCDAQCAVAVDGVYAYVKGKGSCNHQVANDLDESITGLPPWAKVILEARVFELNKTGRSMLIVKFQADIWKPFSSRLHRDRHFVINDHATITELKKRAAAWLSHLKRTERAELAARAKLYPMNKQWGYRDYDRFRQEHMVPLPPSPHNMPKSIRELDDLAVTMGMGRPQSAGQGNATLEGNPSLKLFVCAEPSEAEEPLMKEINAMDPKRHRRNQLLVISSMRFIWNAISAKLNLDLEVVFSSDGTPVNFRGRRRMMYLGSLLDVRKRKGSPNNGYGAATLSARLLFLYLGITEDMFCVTYSLLCFNYTLKRLIGLHFCPRLGCVQDKSYSIINAMRFVYNVTGIALGFEHCVFKVCRLGSSHRKAAASWQPLLLQPGHDGAWMEKHLLPDLLDMRGCYSVAMLREYAIVVAEGWASVHGEPVIAQRLLDTYIFGPFGCSFRFNQFNVAGVYASQNPLESLNRGASNKSNVESSGDINPNRQDGPFILHELSDFVQAHGQTERIDCDRIHPMPTGFQVTLTEKDKHRLDGYDRKVDVHSVGEGVNAIHYVNNYTHVGVPITADRIENREKVISKGDLGSIQYNDRRMVTQIAHSLCIVRQVPGPLGVGRVWSGSCFWYMKKMECCHCKYVSSPEDVDHELSGYNRPKRRRGAGGLPGLHAEREVNRPIVELPVPVASTHPPSQPNSFEVDVSAKTESLRKYIASQRGKQDTLPPVPESISGSAETRHDGPLSDSASPLVAETKAESAFATETMAEHPSNDTGIANASPSNDTGIANASPSNETVGGTI